jgi:hypothetical protein
MAMLALWLGVCALDVSPRLHLLLHRDAQSPGHACLVTQLQHHLLLPGFVAVLVPVAPTLWGALPDNSDFTPPLLFDYQIGYGRAPPSGFSSPAVVG